MTYQDIINGYENTVMVLSITPFLYMVLLAAISIFFYKKPLKHNHTPFMYALVLFLGFNALNALVFQPASYTEREHDSTNRILLHEKKWIDTFVLPYIDTLPKKRTSDIGVSYPTATEPNYIVYEFGDVTKTYSLPATHVHITDATESDTPYITYTELPETLSASYTQGTYHNIHLYIPRTHTDSSLDDVVQNLETSKKLHTF